MEMANTLITWVMGIVSQFMGWIGGLFGALVPSASASADDKAKFGKTAFIVVVLFFAAQILRVNLKTGGK